MNPKQNFRALLAEGRLNLPSPGCGGTAGRHHSLAEIAREDLALARLAEAHLDAVAILTEAGREVHRGVLYGVWASEIPGHSARLSGTGSFLRLSGIKMFCSGAGLVGRALITVTEPEQRLVEIDLGSAGNAITYDETQWITDAFADTHTATASFNEIPVPENAVIAPPRWYLSRPGFWHGACGPASCWAGGALGLVDYAIAHTRDNPHSLAHLGAMRAKAWELRTILTEAGQEIDRDPDDGAAAMTRALIVRHLIEEACTEILIRVGRAFGPRPLAFDPAFSRRFHELTLYIRQSHAEWDLETLGRQTFRL
jgi:alkylation response protein AidB-like acyl-CoA dehydrogenase